MTRNTENYREVFHSMFLKLYFFSLSRAGLLMYEAAPSRLRATTSNPAAVWWRSTQIRLVRAHPVFFLPYLSKHLNTSVQITSLNAHCVKLIRGHSMNQSVVACVCFLNSIFDMNHVLFGVVRSYFRWWNSRFVLSESWT